MESEWDIDEIPGVTQHRYADGLFVDGKNLLLLYWFPGFWEFTRFDGPLGLNQETIAI